MKITHFRQLSQLLVVYFHWPRLLLWVTLLIFMRGLSWWSYGSWIYNYLYNPCLSPLMWVQILLRRGVLDTTLCDKVCQWLAVGRWLSPGTPVSPIIKTDRNDITEILLKVASNLIHNPNPIDQHVYSYLHIWNCKSINQ